jgi:hypothetical protein
VFSLYRLFLFHFLSFWGLVSFLQFFFVLSFLCSLFSLYPMILVLFSFISVFFIVLCFQFFVALYYLAQPVVFGKADTMWLSERTVCLALYV